MPKLRTRTSLGYIYNAILMVIVNLSHKHLFFLLLEFCGAGEFVCEVSKLCITNYMQCNGENDCISWEGMYWEDGSDERGCGKLSGDLISY